MMDANEKNAQNTEFAQVRYTAGTRRPQNFETIRLVHEVKGFPERTMLRSCN